MGTWIVHLRVAERFMNILNGIDADEFVLGSIAPDCGYGKKDSPGEFVPPPKVTHWSPSGKKYDCRYEKFFRCYLMDKEINSDYSFYLGYYIHLLTDILWSSTIYMPIMDRHRREEKSRAELNKKVKKEFNMLDMAYLKAYPEFKPYKILKDRKGAKDYLDYYKPGQLSVQSRYIAKYYSGYEDVFTENKYKYIQPAEVDEFIDFAQKHISANLKRRSLLK